ncbi:COP9 signalosome complex subunit 2-like protein [Corchorus olitorius]|uniref:COP9 signalosome complex subunit 2-like protein n=1 Tax=Corchorus olitorius TaxID=93759 RepID=A0A1R3I4D2_9ROSI|nr:COP9 signalosome complex subunit 2-like protein [Corchorus olitorius]
MDKGKKELKEVYQKKKTVKKSEKLKAIEEEIDADLKKAVGDFAKSRTEKYLTESPSVIIPANHFRNIAHKLRYDDVDKFTLKPVKTFNWENLSQNPVYAGLHEKFINMNWMGIVHVNEKQMSDSAVKEFYSGIQTDNTGNDLHVHFCGKEVIITALTLGQALNIEWIMGDVKPPEDFDVNEAWKKLNDNDEIFPTLRSERRIVRDDVKLTLLFIRNNIWFDQSEEDYITEREV